VAGDECACVIEARRADVDSDDAHLLVTHRVPNRLRCPAACNQRRLDRVDRSVRPDEMVRDAICPPIVELACKGVEIGDGWGIRMAVVEGFDRIRVGVVHERRSCQALIIPARSLASTLSTLNDAGSWLGGNSASV
jgi:hypothetical protein